MFGPLVAGVSPGPSGGRREDTPFGQVVFDNVFLWLSLGVAVPVLFYLIWGFVDIASTPELPEAAAIAGAPAAEAPPPPPAGAEVVEVVLDDFEVRSPVTTFQAGVPYRFVVTNRGVDEHEFMVGPTMPTAGMSMEMMDEMALGVIERDELGPGATRVLDLTFREPAPAGALELSCHLPGHWESGMRLPITVTGDAQAPAEQVEEHGDHS